MPSDFHKFMKKIRLFFLRFKSGRDRERKEEEREKEKDKKKIGEIGEIRPIRNS